MKIANTKWTERDIAYLKQSYGKATLWHIADHLGKTPTAITSKVHYLRQRGWTFDSTRR